MFDYPLPFILATQPRSGFFFLNQLLRSTEAVGETYEWFIDIADKSVDYLDDSEMLARVANYYKEATCKVDSQYWGMKLDMNYLRFWKRFSKLVGIIPSSLKWIWLIRKNKLAQAASVLKAVQAGVWHIRQDDSAKQGKLIYHGMTTDELWIETNKRIEEDKMWSAYFTDNKIEPYIIYYEDFIQSETWQQLVASILDFLGVRYELPLRLSHNLVKTGNEFILI